jgi:threonine dehydratase
MDSRLSSELAGRKVAVIVSGGNIDAETLRRVVGGWRPGPA